MSLRDSLLVIAHRERFPDLSAALALIGVALDSAAAPVTWRDAPAAEAGPPFVGEAEERPQQAAAADGWSADDIRQAEDRATPFESQEHAEESQTGDGDRRGENAVRAASARKTRALPVSRPAEKPPSVIAGIIDADFQVMSTAHAGPAAFPAYLSIPKSQSAGAATRSAADTAFNTRTLSSALHSMVRVEREGAEPNIDAVVARIAAGEPLSRVPTTPRRGPPNRVCVLCDLNLRSGPYREDVRYLIRVARRLLGDGSLEFLTFKGTPAKGCGMGPIWTWTPYAELPSFDITMIIGCGTANRDGDPQGLHSFAMQLIAAEREVCVVLIGAEPGTPKTRPYPQLLVRD